MLILFLHQQKAACNKSPKWLFLPFSNPQYSIQSVQRIYWPATPEPIPESQKSLQNQTLPILQKKYEISSQYRIIGRKVRCFILNLTFGVPLFLGNAELVDAAVLEPTGANNISIVIERVGMRPS